MMKQSNIVKILFQLEEAGVDPFGIIKDVNLQEETGEGKTYLSLLVENFPYKKFSKLITDHDILEMLKKEEHIVLGMGEDFLEDLENWSQKNQTLRNVLYSPSFARNIRQLVTYANDEKSSFVDRLVQIMGYESSEEFWEECFFSEGYISETHLELGGSIYVDALLSFCEKHSFLKTREKLCDSLLRGFIERLIKKQDMNSLNRFATILEKENIKLDWVKNVLIYSSSSMEQIALPDQLLNRKELSEIRFVFKNPEATETEVNKFLQQIEESPASSFSVKELFAVKKLLKKVFKEFPELTNSKWNRSLQNMFPYLNIFKEKLEKDTKLNKESWNKIDLFLKNPYNQNLDGLGKDYEKIAPFIEKQKLLDLFGNQPSNPKVKIKI